ncbi:hypothetical protein J1G18_07500 [Pseudomonas sp. MIS38]|uniref:hypothetical protein n=1 Tax=Pseudomonas sp. MIS38 TaxID=91465 RepID=UPI001CA71B82|nr:hypothetical protein [Pseudomonas sp. MIS38]MBY8957127.1 hypothetical protein [Pseudomonas sp. MIS38]
MSTDHKEQLNSLIIQILKKVIDACPAQVELNANAFGIDTESFDACDIPNSFNSAKSQENLLRDTLDWLVAEGFIRVGSKPDHYVATSKSVEQYESILEAQKK